MRKRIIILLYVVDKPGRSANRFGVLLYAFGYGKNTDFAAMPKIRIITAANKLRDLMPENSSLTPGFC